MPEEDPIAQTMQTYNQVASQFVQRHKQNGWWDQPNPNFERFVQRLPAKARVLDLGCGPGSDTAHFRRAQFVAFGLDRSIGMLTQAQAHVGASFAQADMRQIPLAAACLDAVWMQASLLHLPRSDAPRALAEVERVLRPGGWLYLSVKQGDGEETLSNLGNQPRYFVYYQPRQVQQLVTGAGLRVPDQWLNETPQVNWIGLIAVKPGP